MDRNVGRATQIRKERRSFFFLGAGVAKFSVSNGNNSDKGGWPGGIPPCIPPPSKGVGAKFPWEIWVSIFSGGELSSRALRIATKACRDFFSSACLIRIWRNACCSFLRSVSEPSAMGATDSSGIEDSCEDSVDSENSVVFWVLSLLEGVSVIKNQAAAWGRWL